jgi:hypothetical protein
MTNEEKSKLFWTKKKIAFSVRNLRNADLFTFGLTKCNNIFMVFHYYNLGMAIIKTVKHFYFPSNNVDNTGAISFKTVTSATTEYCGYTQL